MAALALGLLSAGYSTPASESGPSSPNKALYDYLGNPVLPPPDMDAAYTTKGLTAAMQAAAKAAGITLVKLQIDDSEFPFLVGVTCANEQDMEKLKGEIRKMPAYNYTGGVGGGRSASYAMNLVHYRAYPVDARQRIERRLSLREQILFDKMHKTPHAPPEDLPTFGAPAAEGSIRVKVDGYGVERPGYYFLPRGATVRDAFKAARGTERADWRRPYSGIVRKKPDGTEEHIWFTRKGRESDENLALQNGDDVRFSHERY